MLRLTALALGLTGWLAGQTPGAPVAPAVPAAPPVMPYITEHALDGMHFDQPLDIVTAPGEPKSLYVLEKSGRIVRIPDVTAAKPERVVFLDLSAEIGSLDVERGLLALAFHPDYQKNHQFYVWFTVTNATNTESFDRLARFKTGSDGLGDPKSEQPLISQIDRAANHNGGELKFGPDGYLYLTIGDEGQANDVFKNSQLIDHNFFSGMHRLDVDQRPGNLKPSPNPAVHEGTYLVPKDNPFVGATSFNGAPVDPANVRTEFWAVGLRNAWRFSFDSATGLLWLGDVGQDRIEEVDLIRRGGNYGWNYREADGPFLLRGQLARTPPAGISFDEPIFSYRHSNFALPGNTDIGNCIVGGFVYHGQALPALQGHYLFADYVSGWIWSLTPVDGKGGKVTVEKIARIVGIVSFGQDPVTGEVLLANDNQNPRTGGFVERLRPNPAYTPGGTARP